MTEPFQPAAIDPSGADSPAALPEKRKHSMPLRTRLMFWLTAWLIVLLPFLFWRSTWFGLPLTDSQMQQYLHDDAKPRHIQHALVQLADRMQHHDARAQRWYPDLTRLSAHSVEEIRTTDAWTMGQDPTRPEFHSALLPLLHDPSPLVRANAALSLVSFGDAAGHDEIAAMLQSQTVVASRPGKLIALAKPGEAIRRGTMLARISDPASSASDQVTEIRSPITGHIHSTAKAIGDAVSAGDALAIVDPGAEQAWEALRALYLIGRVDDLPLVREYQRASPAMPERIRQQAQFTEQAILERARK